MIIADSSSALGRGTSPRFRAATSELQRSDQERLDAAGVDLCSLAPSKTGCASRRSSISPRGRLIRELDGSRTLQEALAAVADVDVMRESGLSFRILERGFPELGRLSADREPDPFGRLTRLWR
jgi:hypothetical protein